MKAGWTEVALGEVATLDRTVVAPEDIADGTLYVGLEHIERGGRLRDVVAVSNGDVASSKFAFDATQILYGKLRPNLAKIARPDFGGVCSTDILPIDAGPRIDRGYLAHFLLRPQTVELAARRATGANLPRLSPNQLTAIQVPLPPLDEQRRIARVLDAADALQRRQEAAVASLQVLRKSLFVAFMEPHQEDWPVVSVAELVDPGRGGIRTGPFGSQLLHGEFVADGIAVLGIDNAVQNEFRWAGRRYVTEEKYDQLQRYTVHPGDVLITIMGTCGRAAVVPDDIGVAINTKHLCCISLDRGRCSPTFLHSYFLHDRTAQQYLQARAKGAIMSGLNLGIIKQLPVTLPPIEAQRALEQRLERVDALSRRIVRRGEDLDALFASLRERAFAGTL
jgi:type I restriction enzyme S subunit